jgi:hypothetical protein
MNAEDIVGAVLRGVLTSRPKSARKTLRRLSHGHLLSTRNILTAAAAAWGIYEAMQGGSTGGIAGPLGTGPRPQPAGGTVPPPTPSFPTPQAGRVEGAAPMPPPLPMPVGIGRPAPPAASAPPAPPADDQGFPPQVARAVRLLIAAARADGDLKPEEGAQIARHAAEAGAEALVRAELQQHRSAAEIVRGVVDPAEAGTLYAMAFAVLRADEDMNAAERGWLAELEGLLKLDPPAARRIESEVAGAIDAEGSSDAEG